MTEKTVITGMGLVLPCGPDAASNWKAQKPCFAPLPEPLHYKGLQGAQCEPFSTAGIIPPLVNRRLNRTTRLAWVAAKEAFEQARLDPESLGEKLGMVTGTLGSGNDATEAFMLPYLEHGPEAASPMLFPNSVAVSISGNLSTGFKFKGPSATQLGRENSTLIALTQGIRWLDLGMAEAILAIGTDSLYPILSEILWRSRLASRHALPIVGSRQGFLPGEGAQAFILEKKSRALSRRVPILATLEAIESCAAVDCRPNPDRTPHAQALQKAVEALPLDKPSEGWIAGSNGHRMLDDVEAPLIKHHPHWPVPRYPKCLWGECCGAGGQLLAAALLDDARSVLITAPASNGSQVAMFITKPE